ncbi:MAG TPA: hypothetical protein VH796_00280 [Nitrososphaeraceae archaeon]|jgi:hypothetical protein
MNKLAIALAIGIAAASIIGGSCVVVNHRRNQQQHKVLAEPEIDLALTS